MQETELRPGSELTGLEVARAVLSFLLFPVVWGGLLFWAAGTFSWGRAWLHLGLWIVTAAVNVTIILLKNPAGLAARMKRLRIGERFDKVIVSCLIPATLAIPVVAGLDAVRYGWALLPLWPVGIGVVLHVAGDVFIVWAMVVNPYLEGGVRIQSERGHRTITTGPYAIVRHPMYVGFILVLAGMPPVLGSWWAFAPAGVVGTVLIIRTAFEDRLLRERLPGYEDYAAKTRRRLLPGIW
jgi:protein-S-isoprenylcysteine O-methyltransferase Ste14